MNSNDIIKSKEIEHKNKKILLSVALFLNKELFDENEISYKIFKYTEENILKDLKNQKGEETLDLYTVRKKLNMGESLTGIHLRVTDYARVSTDADEQKKSLKNQVEHFEQYIKQNPNWTYIPGYVDDGITGTSDIKRDNFMQMIEDAHLGKFDLIVTKEISRFSRNTLDSIKYTRELLSLGVAVLFVNDNINTAMPDAELRLTIMASMAQDEIRRLSERVKFGMNRAIERGEILGNDMLYGYKKNKDTGVLIIIEEYCFLYIF